MKRFAYALCVVVVAATSQAQEYPTRTVRLVTSEAGGGLDFAARLIGQGLSANLGQQFITDNRGGAGGAIAIETVMKAPPDGATLLVYGSSVWMLPIMRASTVWDPQRDFSPVTLAVTSPNMLVVHPSVEVSSVKELIALARRKPGEITYASSGSGSTAHLATELFKSMAGVDLIHVPFKGSGPALTAMLGGQTQVMFSIAAAAIPHVKASRLKALAVTSSAPSALLPGLPTVAAAGLPGYESGTLMCIFAPAGTPPAIVGKLNQEIVRVLRQPETRDKFLGVGAEVVGSSIEQLTVAMKADAQRMGKVIRDANIRAD